MANVFRPSTNVLARLSIALLGLAPVALIVGGSQYTRSPYVTRVDTPLEQPVPFSHEHHVNELGIDCRYCHSSVDKSSNAGFPPTHTCMSCHSQIWSNSPLLEPVRESYEKNVPLKWQYLNKLPDFVFFNHSIHIKKGVSCNICHGPIQSMQMTARGKAFEMRWCLECHRNPENYIRPTEEVWNLYREFQKNAAMDDPEKEALRLGNDFKRKGEALEEGRRLVKEYKIKREQLTDCNICHR